MKGFWNGEPAKFKGLEYTVTEVKEKPLSWQNSLVGTRRQAIEIDYSGHTFIIDNQDGLGFIKVTEGRGLFKFAHKSVINPINISYINDKEVNKQLKTRLIRTQKAQYKSWALINHPQEYKRLQALGLF